MDVSALIEGESDPKKKIRAHLYKVLLEPGELGQMYGAIQGADERRRLQARTRRYIQRYIERNPVPPGDLGLAELVAAMRTRIAAKRRGEKSPWTASAPAPATGAPAPKTRTKKPRSPEDTAQASKKKSRAAASPTAPPATVAAPAPAPAPAMDPIDALAEAFGHTVQLKRARTSMKVLERTGVYQRPSGPTARQKAYQAAELERHRAEREAALRQKDARTMKKAIDQLVADLRASGLHTQKGV